MRSILELLSVRSIAQLDVQRQATGIVGVLHWAERVRFPAELDGTAPLVCLQLGTPGSAGLRLAMSAVYCWQWIITFTVQPLVLTCRTVYDPTEHVQSG